MICVTHATTTNEVHRLPFLLYMYMYTSSSICTRVHVLQKYSPSSCNSTEKLELSTYFQRYLLDQTLGAPLCPEVQVPLPPNLRYIL